MAKSKPLVVGHVKQAVEPARRVAVGEILRILSQDATRRINTARSPNVEATPPITQRAERWFLQYRVAKKVLADRERQLLTEGLQVHYSGTKLRASSALQAERRSTWDAVQARRLSKVQALIAEAWMDLLEVRGVPVVKARLKRLQQALSGI